MVLISTCNASEQLNNQYDTMQRTQLTGAQHVRTRHSRRKTGLYHMSQKVRLTDTMRFILTAHNNPEPQFYNHFCDWFSE